MKIIFFGTPQEVIPVLENLTNHFEVVAVVTTPDQKSGRKQMITPSPVKSFAQTKNIPTITPAQFSNETIAQLRNYKPELFVVAAYGKLIPELVLKIPKFGAINIHPSLLPQYRGPTPLQTALLNGDEKSGVTFIKMDEEMDHGPILHQLLFTLEKTDTFGWLMQSTFTQAAQILPHVIEEYSAGKLEPQPQNDSKATYTQRITKEDGYIDLLNPPAPDKLDRMIRAYYPWPTVWTTIKINNREIRIKFLPTTVIARSETTKQSSPFALQVEGKNPVTVKDFLNGYPKMKEQVKKLFNR